MEPETVQRIEPARPEEATEALTDAIADLVAAAIKLGQALHPRTAANLADLVRIANTYYSNLIEGLNSAPGTSSARSPATSTRTRSGATSKSKRRRTCRYRARLIAWPRKGSLA